MVTIPAGQTISNAFALFGVSVGSTALDIIPLSGGFVPSSFPAGAWDVNTSGAANKFVDANPPSATCRAGGTANISQDPSVLATCGTPVTGAASDGATQLLMRTLAGLQGTACYEITSTSSFDQGTVATPLASTQAGANNLNYAFSLYKVPADYADTSNSRTVTVTFTYTPSIGNGNTTSFTADLTVLRPPVVLVHGLWSKPSAWGSSFVRNDSTHTTVTANYKSTNASHFAVNIPFVQQSIQNALQQFRATQNAVTQVDVIGHSMGGILSRLYSNSSQNTRVDNYNLGDVHRIITLDTPHWGSTLANLLVSLHTVAPTRGSQPDRGRHRERYRWSRLRSIRKQSRAAGHGSDCRRRLGFECQRRNLSSLPNGHREHSDGKRMHGLVHDSSAPLHQPRFSLPAEPGRWVPLSGGE